MSAPTIEAWIIHAMDVYDKQGLYPGCAAFGQVQSFAAAAAETDRRVALDEIHHALELFIPPLGGWGAGCDAPDPAARRFHALETARLNACLARELPGLYRDMREIQRLA